MTSSVRQGRPAHRTRCAPGSRTGANVTTVRSRWGNCGVFSGSRFRREIYPQIRDFIAEMSNADYDEAGRER